MEDGLLMSKIVNQQIKFKRGQQAAVERLNPILAAGEPLAVFCFDGKTRLKIGDGITPYSELDFIGEDTDTEILVYPTELDFPQPPKNEQLYYLYKASNKATLYRWNADIFRYEAIDTPDVEISIDNIEVITGGSADELLA